MRLTFPLYKAFILTLFYGSTTRTTLAQEAPHPSFQLPLFAETEGFRQDVCDRNTRYAMGQVELADALQGLELHSIIGLNQYFQLDDQGRIPEENPGIAVKLMDELARRAGFSWRNSYAVLDENGLPEGSTFNEMLMWTVRNYDVLVSYWFDTLERRSKGVSTPEAWVDASIIMVSLANDNQDESFNVFLFLRPFTNSVWALIIASVFASALVYWILELIDRHTDKGRLVNNPLENVYLSAISLTGQFEFAPRTAAAQLFAVSVAFMALIVASAYTANLASHLVVRNTGKVAIQSLEEAVRLQVPMCIWRSTGTDNSVSKAFPNAKFIRMDSPTAIFEGVLSGQCELAVTEVLSWDYYSRQQEVNAGCRLDWIGRTFRTVQSGFSTLSDSGARCTSLIRDVLNLHLGEMKQEGFIDEAYEEHLATQSDLDCSLGYEKSTKTSISKELGLKNMGGIFVFHFGVSVVVIIIALVNAEWRKRRTKVTKLSRKQRRLARRGKLHSEFSNEYVSSDGDAELPTMIDSVPAIERARAGSSDLESVDLDSRDLDSRDSQMEVKTLQLEMKHLSRQNQYLHQTTAKIVKELGNVTRNQVQADLTTEKILRQLQALTTTMKLNTLGESVHSSGVARKEHVSDVDSEIVGVAGGVSESTDATNKKQLVNDGDSEVVVETGSVAEAGAENRVKNKEQFVNDGDSEVVVETGSVAESDADHGVTINEEPSDRDGEIDGVAEF